MKELYKKYRPKKLSQIIGNSATVNSIAAKLKNNSLPHFILLSGPSGCGKTTIARIIAKELKCNSSDFYEVNCANKNGVELARDIESKFRMKAISGGVRIWLLDEAHKLTSACSESLLKPLEDTPDHVYFIMASTDPGKILKTIKTRATEYSVSSLTDSECETLMDKVCKKEKLSIPIEVKEVIVEACLGSARDMLVNLDKIKDLDEEEMLEAAKQIVEKNAIALEIYKALMWGKWTACAAAIKNNKEEPEGIRRYILACANNVLLDPKKSKDHAKAFSVLSSFENPLYNIGKPGLTMCCYDVFN